MEREVVVTGVGIISSIGEDYQTFVEGLRAGVCGITKNDEDGFGIAARLKDFNFDVSLARLQLPEGVLQRARKAGRRAPIVAQSSIITVLEAWDRSFGVESSCESRRTSVIVAGSNFNSGYHYRMAEKQLHDEMVSASYALHFLDTDLVGLISEILGIHGEGFSVGGASASGNLGLIQAFRQVKHGMADVCIVIGPMADLSPVELESFGHTGALGGKQFANQPEQACRPFDAEREGFIYGQGSACLILESEDSATARDAEIWAKVSGGATCLDGNRLTNPNVEGEMRAMRLALENAGVDAGDVDYINTHGTSSRLGDEVEATAIGEVFGNIDNRPVVNATKGLVGHCLFSASLVEAVATIAQMKEGFVHPNRNLLQPIKSRCCFAGEVSQPLTIDVALCNGFAFGGINSAVVLSRHNRQLTREK